MAASKISVKQPYEFFKWNRAESLFIPSLLRPSSFFLLLPPPSPPFPRRRPTHFWFIWGLCLKRVKVSQRARSLNFLAEQLSTVLEIPRLVKRKTYAEFLSLKETDLLVVCLLWTKGHAMPNPSIAITSGFFANGSFFFFFHSFRVSIFRDYSLGNIEFSAHWIRFHSSIRIQKVTPIHFPRFSKRSAKRNSERFATVLPAHLNLAMQPPFR